MAIDTAPITAAADDLASSLTEGATAVDELAQGIVDALNQLEKRLAAVEEGGTTPPVEPPIEPPIEPPTQTGSIPLAWNDQRFSGNTQSSNVIISSGQTVAKKTITETGHTASIVSQGGGGTVDTCRVNSREAHRVASSGTHTIKDSYLECLGQGDDHADTIQTYAPGSRGTLAISNTSIVAHTQAATAGLFVADNWTGTISLTDVVFNGGPYGCRIYSDKGGDNIIKFRNVFFVGPFGYGTHDIGNYGGHRNIIEVWENVRHATIQNGQLVPGNAINKPNTTEALSSAESMTKERAIKEMKTSPSNEATSRS